MKFSLRLFRTSLSLDTQVLSSWVSAVGHLPSPVKDVCSVMYAKSLWVEDSNTQTLAIENFYPCWSDHKVRLPENEIRGNPEDSTRLFIPSFHFTWYVLGIGKISTLLWCILWSHDLRHLSLIGAHAFSVETDDFVNNMAAMTCRGVCDPSKAPCLG